MNNWICRLRHKDECASRRDAILVEYVILKNINPVGVAYSRRWRMKNIELLTEFLFLINLPFYQYSTPTEWVLLHFSVTSEFIRGINGSLFIHRTLVQYIIHHPSMGFSPPRALWRFAHARKKQPHKRYRDAREYDDECRNSAGIIKI